MTDDRVKKPSTTRKN